MPGGDGRDLVERLGRMRPTIKALYISGHIEANVARGGALLSAAFLQKPFTMDYAGRKGERGARRRGGPDRASIAPPRAAIIAAKAARP